MKNKRFQNAYGRKYLLDGKIFIFLGLSDIPGFAFVTTEKGNFFACSLKILSKAVHYGNIPLKRAVRYLKMLKSAFKNERHFY